VATAGAKPQRLVVFRCDRDPLVCRSRVRLLRRLNPDVPIYGLFGGDSEVRALGFRLGGRAFLDLDGLYRPQHDGYWSWKNGDLALAAWYRDVGNGLKFDLAHLVEWDLLLLEPLERAYASVPPAAVGLTAVTPVAEIGGSWPWLAGAEREREWDRLRAWARESLGYGGAERACLGVGPCFPRSFLARYSALDVPEFCNDELRLPLLAEALGYRVVDTGFRRWNDPEADPYFNIGKMTITQSAVDAEWRREDGRRVFHPFRVPYAPERRPLRLR